MEQAEMGVEEVVIQAATPPEYSKILTPEALQFILDLHRQFDRYRKIILEQRVSRQKEFDAGEKPGFLDHTWAIRESQWRVAPLPDSLQERRVEITGPVDRKMIINALNSGANVFMADFEDSTSPTWQNVIEGQINLHDAIRREIDFEQPDGKRYALNDHVAVLKVRPRGWHLPEKHIRIDGQPASASLVDFGLYFFHNWAHLAAESRGPFFYLPKLENHLEARLWNDVFNYAQDAVGLPRGTIKATVLIETITAAFEMDEIIYELREHLAGLNAGRWDYIFSIIKKLKNHQGCVLPDRSLITMEVPFMEAYAKLLVKTCHRRGAHAIGGMSAFIPSKDEAINTRAFEQVTRDKQREANQGYDGTWVAHPKLVSVAADVFNAKLGGAPHQKHELCDDVHIAAEALLDMHSAPKTITEKGVRTNINVALLYIESWLSGVGAAALYNLMEDAATAEISRAQLWQWLHQDHPLRLEDGTALTTALFEEMLSQEVTRINDQFAASRRKSEHVEQARALLHTLVLNDQFEEFLTTRAYEYL